jgi:polar amino acid transport system substrate-binding protein
LLSYKKGERMKKISVVLVFVMMLSFTTAVFAGPAIDKIVKRGELIIGTSGDYPPFTAKTKDGKLMGLDVDLGMLIADVMEVKAKIVQMPFAELLPALQSGKIDMIISAMTINKPDFTLAVPGGTTSEMTAKNSVPKAQIKVAKDMNEAMKLLLDGKVKAVMSDTAACAVETIRYKEKKIVSTPPLTFEPIGIAIAENDPLFFNFLSNFMSGMKGSGDLDMLTNKWFKDPSWIKDLP